MTASTARVVGVIGLGIMGSAMSARLVKAGWAVVGYDVAEARLAAAAEAGFTSLDSVSAMARSAELLITSLSTGRALLEVTAELAATATAIGAATATAIGTGSGTGTALVVLETSTLPLEVKQQAQAIIAGAGGILLDCPLSGTGEQARRGDLVAYLSGDDAAAKAAARPVLEAIGRAHHDLGPFGNGTRMKLVANLLVAVHNAAAAEALLLAEHAGLDLGAVLAAVGDGAGSSRMFEVRGPMMADRRYDVATMRIDTFAKDLEIIRALARETGSVTPLFDVAAELYAAATAQGRHAQDTAAVHAVLAARSAPGLPDEGEGSP